MQVCEPAGVYVHHTYMTTGGRNRVPELEAQGLGVAVWVLGTKAMSFAGAASHLYL